MYSRSIYTVKNDRHEMLHLNVATPLRAYQCTDWASTRNISITLGMEHFSLSLNETATPTISLTLAIDNTRWIKMNARGNKSFEYSIPKA